MELSFSTHRFLAMGIDERVLEERSPLWERVLAYAEGFSEAHIICRSSRPREEKRAGQIVFHSVFTRRNFLYPFLLWRLGRRVLRNPGAPWLIVSENPFELGAVAWLLSRQNGAALQLQVHTDFMSPYYRRASPKERIRWWLARFLIPRADCIRVVSERVRKSTMEMIGSRTSYHLEVRLPIIAVLPIFTDTSKFLEAKPDAATERRFKDFEFKMLAVGRFVDKEKNFSMLIEMMRDFIKICPKALLVLVGSGPNRGNYELGIRNYGLQKHVILEGWRDDLPSLYKSFDLYLMSSNYEGWGRAVIEAMASGLPVVMTDVGLAGEVVESGKNGVIVPVGSREAFLEAVTDLCRNSEKRVQLVRNGRETIKNLEPKTEEAYLARYRESLHTCISSS